MNRFMYLSKRNFSNEMKAFYPKCINCINFKKEERSCKKFVTSGNYINYNSNNELADNARNDNTKCGESGKLFDIGKEKLEKDNSQVLNISCGLTLLTGVLTFVTEDYLLLYIPSSISFFTFLIFLFDFYDYQKIIVEEKERVENLNKLISKNEK